MSTLEKARRVIGPVIPVRAELSAVLEALEKRSGNLPQHEAAGLMQLSASRFRHVFTALTGVTYRDFCVQFKVGRGAILLQSTSLSVQRISMLLGYADRRKFEKAFKQHFEITPAQYRHKKRKR